MSHQATTRTFLYGKAPRKIELLGDKTRRPESATHIIEFPGGAIEVSRTTDGDYWAHIMVNRDFALPDDCEGLRAAYGEIVGSRIDYEFPADPNVIDIPNAKQVRQIAILIKPHRGESSPATSVCPNMPLPLADAIASWV